MNGNPYEPPQVEQDPGDPELRRHLATLRILFWLSLALSQVCFLAIGGTAGVVFGSVFVVFTIAAAGIRRWLKEL